MAMYNYCIFVIIWLGCTLLGISLGLASRLGKAFANARETPALEPPIEVGSTGGRVVLQYARPSPKKPSVYCRRPWLAGSYAVLEAALVGCWALAPAILMGTMAGMLWQYAIAAMVMGAAALLGVLLIVWRGLRVVGGVPAAANWPRRRLRNLLLCGVGVCVLSLVVLDAGAKSRMRRLREQMSEQSEGLRIAVPAGTANAADLYRQAFSLTGAVPDWSGRYLINDRSPAGPPVLSAQQESAVAVLREATQLPVAEWGVSFQTYKALSPLPHLNPIRLSASLLRIHAADEAQAGRLDSAIKDIRAIRAPARHAGQGRSMMESLMAVGVDDMARQATEDLLPFVNDERLLAQLAVPDDGWHQNVMARGLRGELAFVSCVMADMYDGSITGMGTPAPSPTLVGFPLGRVFLVDTEVAALGTVYEEAAVVAAKPADSAVPAIRRFQTQLPAYHQRGGVVAAMMTGELRTGGQKGGGGDRARST